MLANCSAVQDAALREGFLVVALEDGVFAERQRKHDAMFVPVFRYVGKAPGIDRGGIKPGYVLSVESDAPGVDGQQAG
ncbi:hypothetical protein D3C71_1906990 [compost metagenome]